MTSCPYNAGQLTDAWAIVQAAGAFGLDEHAAALGITAALGESGLENIDHGDGVMNPDGTVASSVGLFQQQDWWGTYTERMDPTSAASAFFVHLERVHGRGTMQPTLAIHAVQGNADPQY